MTAGVAGFDGNGVAGRTESAAESAGEGGIIRPWLVEVLAARGIGATMGEPTELGVGSLTLVGAVDTSGL